MSKAWASEYNIKMRPITKKQTEDVRKSAARFIFVKDKSGNSICQRCEKEFVLSKSKHLEKCKCPKCHKEMQIQHVWRMKNYLEAINWIAIPKVINNNTLVIRYICGYSVGYELIGVKELARMYISEEHADPEYYCEFQGEWHRGKNPYFVPWYMSYRRNRWFCMYADLYQPAKAKAEIDKLDCFKYYPMSEHYDNTRIVSQMHYQIKYARINEKLTKVGMQKIVDDNLNAYINNTGMIRISKTKTNLISMLRLDKPRYNILKQYPSLEVLNELQGIKHFNAEVFGEICHMGFSSYERKRLYSIAEDDNINVLKLARYLHANNIQTYYYSGYLNDVRKLGLNMSDDYYIFPKDFNKTRDKVHADYMAMTVEIKRKELINRAKKESDKTATIKAISDVIRTAPELQDMFADAEHGLKIYVPESIADLYMSGLVMHNCLSTFAERIVRKETLVFFIRRIEAPDEDYVAFEYYNGCVKQIYESNNREVENVNVINFADHFVEKLNEIEIMKRIV